MLSYVETIPFVSGSILDVNGLILKPLANGRSSALRIESASPIHWKTLKVPTAATIRRERKRLNERM